MFPFIVDISPEDKVYSNTQAKTPVLASKVGGIEELIIDHKTGYLVETNNALELTKTLISLFEKDVRLQVVESAFTRVQKDYL